MHPLRTFHGKTIQKNPECYVFYHDPLLLLKGVEIDGYILV
jgi:hypothetical protein